MSTAALSGSVTMRRIKVEESGPRSVPSNAIFASTRMPIGVGGALGSGAAAGRAKLASAIMVSMSDRETGCAADAPIRGR